MTDAISQFKNAINGAGLEPPEVIEPGQWHRFPGEGKKNDNRAGWCKLFSDLLGGIYGDFSTGLSEKWIVDQGKPLSQQEKTYLREQIQAAKEQMARVRAKEQQEAAAHANRLWQSAKSTESEHPYLSAKAIQAHGIRQLKTALLIPLYDDAGHLCSLQFITPSGSKRFLSNGRISGCYYRIGQPVDTICLAEGYATAASIHEATGYPVAVAFNAGNLKSVAKSLRARFPNTRLIICADNDVSNTGQEKAQGAAALVAGEVVVPPETGDWNDYAAAHGLKAVCSAIQRPPKPQIAFESEIRLLSGLTAIEYDRERKSAAEKLGIRASVLDAEVKKLRKPEQKAEPSFFKVVEPWPEPVDGSDLLYELTESARRFLTLRENTDIALALWVLFTHVIDVADHAPIMAITAPEKRCGKTTTLHWLSQLVAKPLPAANMTAATVFRAVEKWQPTLLIDEADTFIRNSDELRGVLNSGHSRHSAYVLRTVGDDHEPHPFSTWSAKAIAMIGQLPDTLADRSINIEMRRKLPHEQIEKMRDSGGLFSTLRQKCVRFAADNAESIRQAQPEPPPVLNDRAIDNWQTLLAIAEISGGNWLSMARAAAVQFSDYETEGDTANTELLRDTKDVFEFRKLDRIRTADLLEALCEDDESPWLTWNRGKPMTSRQLAKKLREFGITPNQTIRFGNTTAKGYRREQFEDAFQRYITPQSVTRSHSGTDADYSVSMAGNTRVTVTDANSLKCANPGLSDPVTDRPSLTDAEAF